MEENGVWPKKQVLHTFYSYSTMNLTWSRQLAYNFNSVQVKYSNSINVCFYISGENI